MGSTYLFVSLFFLMDFRLCVMFGSSVLSCSTKWRRLIFYSLLTCPFVYSCLCIQCAKERNHTVFLNPSSFHLPKVFKSVQELKIAHFSYKLYGSCAFFVLSHVAFIKSKQSVVNQCNQVSPSSTEIFYAFQGGRICFISTVIINLLVRHTVCVR